MARSKKGAFNDCQIQKVRAQQLIVWESRNYYVLHMPWEYLRSYVGEIMVTSTIEL